MAEIPDPLTKLREPFPAHQISKLPKETKAQADARKNDRRGIKCGVCGGWHHPEAVHLDYVGHAALTDRLLDVDPMWHWEPAAFTPEGLPAFDRVGGLWIKLTVCGVTRFGYGCADGKSGGDAVKEIIGDALRNAAMRFGAALDLWHKGDLHADEHESEPAHDNVTPLKKQLQDSVAPPDKPKREVTRLDGPYHTKTQLMAAVRTFMHEVGRAPDPDSLDALVDSEAELIKQVKRDFPGWWDGSETKEPGMEEQIAARRERVIEEANDAWRANPVLAAG